MLYEVITGIDNALSKHPEVKIVADQAADWDATKARNITATILQANPDICGIMGMWDVMDTGTAAAVQEFVITSYSIHYTKLYE